MRIHANNPIAMAKWRRSPSVVRKRDASIMRRVEWASTQQLASAYRAGDVTADDLTSDERAAVCEYLVTFPKRRGKR